MSDVARSERVKDVRRLMAQGTTNRRVIGERVGLSKQYVSELIHDPDGSKAMARKARYGRPCKGCGKTTDGSNGTEMAPELCLTCYRKSIEAPHGTRSRHHSGCGCDLCRGAIREYVRSLRRREGPPPTHSVSGYQNYGCRCKVCKRAWSNHLFLMADERARYPSQRRKTTPTD